MALTIEVHLYGGSRQPGRLRQDVRAIAGGPYITVEELSFTARFLLDPGTDTEGSVANVDAIVDLPDGMKERGLAPRDSRRDARGAHFSL
jgi:hypothetical protein